MAKTYDLKLVICTVDGVPINGFGETDAITIEWASDLVAETVTADGSVVYSRNNDRRAYVTFTLNQKSAAIPLLMAIMEAQHGDTFGIAPPLIIPTAFMLVDPATGDVWSAWECVFMNRPAPSKNKTIGDVQFKLSLPNPSYVVGSLNVL